MRGVELGLRFWPQFGYERGTLATDAALLTLHDGVAELRTYLGDRFRARLQRMGVVAPESSIAYHRDFNAFVVSEVLEHALRNYGGTVSAEVSDEAAVVAVTVQFLDATTTIQFTFAGDEGGQHGATATGPNADEVQPYFDNMLAHWVTDALLTWEVRQH